MSWLAAEMIEEQAPSTSGSMRAASDSIVKGVCAEGNSRFFDLTLPSMVSIESWMIFDRALSSARASGWFTLYGVSYV